MPSWLVLEEGGTVRRRFLRLLSLLALVRKGTALIGQRAAIVEPAPRICEELALLTVYVFPGTKYSVVLVYCIYGKAPYECT